MGSFVAVLVSFGLPGLRVWMDGRGPERLAHPTTAGSLQAPGLAAELVVLRDALGVPHVEAASERDAWFGLGFVHAQDRLGQMLWLRRLARGRAAELVGEAGLATDQLVRTLELGRHADEAAQRLPAPAEAALRAYAAGVNSRLESLDPALLLPGAPLAPAESPWSPADSVALLKLLSLGMGPSPQTSLVFEDLITELGGVGARPLMPGVLGVRGIGIAFEQPSAPVRPKASRWQPERVARTREARQRMLEPTRLRAGAWAVSARHSASGAPLLAAEFQLAPSVPSLLYEAQIRGAELEVIGVTVPGLPVFWAGRNRDVAWALTPARVNDVQLYRETLRPAADGSGGIEYKSGGRWRPVRDHEQEISVRAEEGSARSESLHFRSTHHGPMIAGLVDDPAARESSVSLAWTGARRGDGLGSLLSLARAKNADELVGSLETHHEPALAVVYADREGTVGWQVAGWIPRHRLPAGQAPVPGEQRAFDWLRRRADQPLPGHRLMANGAAPGARGEDAGWVMAADNSLTNDPTSGGIKWLWRNGARARSIERGMDGLISTGPVDLRRLSAMQAELVNRIDPAVLPAIRRLLGPAPGLSSEAREVMALLGEWDGALRPESRGAAAYQVLMDDLVHELLGERLKARTLDGYLALAWVQPRAVIERAILEADRTGKRGGWSDPGRIVKALRKGLHQSWIRLSYKRGPDRRRWVWGGLHELVFRPFVTGAGGAQERLWRYGDRERYPGDGAVVGIADFDPSRPFEARRASSYRVAIDLAMPDRMLTSLAPGQSEQPGRPHYDDGLAPWLAGRSRLLAMSRFLVEEQGGERLVLEPAP